MDNKPCKNCGSYGGNVGCDVCGPPIRERMAKERLARTTCSERFTIIRRAEQPTTHLAWRDGELVQKWEVSDVRDYGGYSSLVEYNEWRPLPTLPNAQGEARADSARPPKPPTQ